MYERHHVLTRLTSAAASSPILDGHSVFDAATRLRKHAAGEAVDIGTYKAYADMRDTPKETRQELQFAGAGLVDAPDGQDALIMTGKLPFSVNIHAIVYNIAQPTWFCMLFRDRLQILRSLLFPEPSRCTIH